MSTRRFRATPERLALLLLALAACSRDTASAAKDTTAAGPVAGFTVTPEQRAKIHLQTLALTSFRPNVEATGTVAFNGDRSTQVLSPVSGPAVKILVNPGDVVQQGQPLALVSSPDFANAVAGYRKALTASANARRIADRDKQLFDNDALARADLDQANAYASAAEADVEAAMEQMRALGVEDSQIAAIRNGTAGSMPLQAVIRAPIAGTVVEKLISPGQLLTAGSTQAFTVADLSSMWVMANVFSGDLSDIAVGQPAEVITDESVPPIAGRVDYIASLVDPASKAVSVRIVAPNIKQALRKDMFVRVAITSSHQHTGLLVPTSSVLRDDQNLPFVFVAVTDVTFSRRTVQLGPRVDDSYAVLGLKPGDKVVTEGALFLQFAQSQ